MHIVHGLWVFLFLGVMIDHGVGDRLSMSEFEFLYFGPPKVTRALGLVLMLTYTKVIQIDTRCWVRKSRTYLKWMRGVTPYFFHFVLCG